MLELGEIATFILTEKIQRHYDNFRLNLSRMNKILIYLNEHVLNTFEKINSNVENSIKLINFFP